MTAEQINEFIAWHESRLIELNYNEELKEDLRQKRRRFFNTVKIKPPYVPCFNLMSSLRIQ